MKENLDTVLQYVLEDEGKYAEHGPGGATNRGISFLLFEEVWRKDSVFKNRFYPNNKPIPTIEDLKNLTEGGASYIYKYHVFPKVDFDNLPSGLDYVMVNTATMEGPTGAIKLLQSTLNLPVTGKMKDVTFSTDTIQMMAGVLLHQANIKLHDKRVKKHGPGWGNRLVRIWERSIKLINR